MLDHNYALLPVRKIRMISVQDIRRTQSAIIRIQYAKNLSGRNTVTCYFNLKKWRFEKHFTDVSQSYHCLYLSHWVKNPWNADKKTCQWPMISRKKKQMAISSCSVMVLKSSTKSKIQSARSELRILAWTCVLIWNEWTWQLQNHIYHLSCHLQNKPFWAFSSFLLLSFSSTMYLQYSTWEVGILKPQEEIVSTSLFYDVAQTSVFSIGLCSRTEWQQWTSAFKHTMPTYYPRKVIWVTVNSTLGMCLRHVCPCVGVSVIVQP